MVAPAVILALAAASLIRLQLSTDLESNFKSLQRFMTLALATLLLLDQEDRIGNIASDDPGPDEVLEQRQRINLLYQALEALPEEKREWLFLSGIQKLNYRTPQQYSSLVPAPASGIACAGF
ncbi:MAG: sigma-70 family RNA polymerase sigma factor [Verrucomicrobia bacterium]|nr:sigma-70 family RNA polymerase sigma factor [Verrucomicrobiota bacterium]